MGIFMEGVMKITHCSRIPYVSILYHGSTGYHTASSYYGDKHCTCIGFRVRKTCKHVKIIEKIVEGDEKMGFTLSDLRNGKIPIRVMDSSIPAINDAFDGKPYTTGAIWSLYGAPNVGKTLFMLQEAFYFISKGLNVLYIDTEGGIAEKVMYWADVFVERFGEPKGEIHFETIRNLKDLLYWFGSVIDVKYVSSDKKKSKGKLVFRIIETLDDRIIDKYITDKKIDVVIVDSITSPYRVRIPISEQQNHPSKSDAIALLYDNLIDIQDKHNVFVLTTHHESINPANVFDVIPRIRGGNTVEYYSKTIVYLHQRDKSGQKDIRRFWFARSNNAQEFTVTALARISSMGYVPLKDMTDKKINNLFTNGELSRELTVYY